MNSRSRTARGRGSASTANRKRAYGSSVRIPLAPTRLRLQIMLVIVILAVMTGVVRAFQLQAYDAQAYAAQAASKMTETNPLPAMRGQFYDTSGQALATTEPAMLIFADRLMIERNGVPTSQKMGPKQRAKAEAAPLAVASILQKHLGGTVEDYLAIITDRRFTHYAVVKRQVPAYTWVLIQADLREGSWFGVYASKDPMRTYPDGDLAANTIGWARTGDDGVIVGAGGYEYSLNSQLTGSPGKESYLYSVNGRKIPLAPQVLEPPVNGTSYALTLDKDMQLIANQALAAGVAKAGAATGTAIVMNVKTGELLAVSNVPTFDSNQYGKVKNQNMNQWAVTNTYEPGSVQKALTFACLANTGKVNATTAVQVPAKLRSGDGYITDAYTHGTVYLTAAGVVAHSSNIGTVLLTRQYSSKAELSACLANFGLGSATSLGLPGETTGRLPGGSMPDYTFDQISFGQGLSVTAVQEAAAVAAIANGGVYNPPSLLKSTTTADGVTTAVPRGEPRRVVSPDAASQTLTMMEAVVTLKAGRAIPNYRMAGKTGTAQRVDPRTGRYSGYTASFVGVAPAEDPQLLVYVVLDKPTNGNEGSVLALPVVQEIMSLALPRYGVLPSTVPPAKTPLTYSP